ncbi:hypothetical protein [Mangrovicoccus algicola]|uniref:Glycosyltransferase family 92 protein n=1 Tax=Mangrovicoccus algicola TaxID=2771008 RepID=A0A8J6Z9Y1_9RHOB|nr:hypothetical protein [Mangrovicoccus algicola]MBE3639065.1 hypothetical protein [Mangrovicoccus algicola]
MTDPIVTVVPIAGYRLPETSALRRDPTRPPERQSAYYLEEYDDRTVIYDCVYLDREGGFLFTAPRFLNLWEPFRNGLRLDGAPVGPMRRVTWLRCEQVFLKAPRGSLSLQIAGETVALEVRDGLAEDFAGLNALVAVSKNNRLDWIANWARFHAAGHRAEAMVLFDNGSTDYTLEELAASVKGTGLKRAVIYSAPFPYGPADKSGRFDVSPRFFQSAMLNLARRDALDRARAVLSIDIDELVLGPEGASVFDMAARHPLGMVTIQGSWVYPAETTEGPAPQQAHVWRAVPDKKCNRKWCMTPRGAMSRAFGWAVHQIGGISQNLFTMQGKFRLAHCRACSTGWKKNRFRFPEAMERDDALAALLRERLGAGE